jgi:hypothetical protein
MTILREADDEPIVLAPKPVVCRRGCRGRCVDRDGHRTPSPPPPPRSETPPTPPPRRAPPPPKAKPKPKVKRMTKAELAEAKAYEVGSAHYTAVLLIM